MKKNNTKFISISELAFNLGLLKSDTEILLSELNPDIRLNHRNQKSVPISHLETLSNDYRYESAKRKSLSNDKAIQDSENPLKKERIKAERCLLLNSYSQYILDLELLHKSCIDRVNFYPHESCITAAYLLFSKAISCLKLGVLSMQEGFWVGGSIFREIDETLDLAFYFIISENTENGKIHLHQWFRQNRAPQHALCREAISKHMTSKIGASKEYFQDFLNELYQSNSKWIHPTYSSIREITHFDTSSGVQIANMEYGGITFETKLIELVHFFRSSISYSFTNFRLCFSEGLPLSNKENELIKEYDRFFQNQSFKNW